MSASSPDPVSATARLGGLANREARLSSASLRSRDRRSFRHPRAPALDYHQPMDSNQTVLRRDLLTAAGTVFTTSLFTGRVKGANDRIAMGFIGVGTMGTDNLKYAMQMPEVQPAAICDVYQPHRERAVAAALKGGFQVKAIADFREILADRSIDAVCIATPTIGMPT